MIYSMTAYTAAERHEEWGSLTLELRSVNHRYLDIIIRLPEAFRSLETTFREKIKSRCHRGKIDCTMRFEPSALFHNDIVLNESLASSLITACNKINSMLTDPAPLHAADILSWQGVVQTADQDYSTCHDSLLTLIDSALDDLLAVRAREGKALVDCILERVTGIEKQTQGITTSLEDIIRKMRGRLDEKLQSVKNDIDPQRLEQEVILLANKSDITEELDRLRTHCKEVRRLLNQDGPLGRRLDFLMQELNREANTLAAKAIDTDTTNASVEIKVLIEQMREQIQNLE